MSRLLNSFFYFIFSLFFLVAFAGSAKAAAPDSLNAWDLGGVGTLNFSQVSLDNWAAGGDNSFSILSNVSGFGHYKKNKHSLDLNADLTYGTIKVEARKWRKSDDKFELNVKYGRRASSDWNYSAQFNFKSQFSPTYDDKDDKLHSNFLSPATIQLSIGMDYKPNKKLSVLISPLTGKYTIVRSQLLADQGKFGVEKAEKDESGEIIPGTGEHIRRELGGYVNVRYKNEVFTNVTLQTKLDLFSNYVKEPENIDFNWENQAHFKVNKFISANLFVHMIYDDDVLITLDPDDEGNKRKGPRLQLKETFGLGLSYKIK